MKSFFKTLLASFCGALLAMVLSGLFFFAIIGSLLSFAESTTPTVPSKAILKINFEHVIAEQGVEDPFDLSAINPAGGSSSKFGILNMIQVIDKAATDPAIEFIYLDTDNMNASLTHAEEIRNALLRFRESGKAVISYCENFSQLGYYLASVSDKIYFHPLGMNELLGTGSTIIFFKDIMDKLGIDVQLIRHGKFKAAGEQFTSNKISDENRLQNQVLVNSIWSSISGDICASRGIAPERFNEMIDNLEVSTPQEMAEANLIDMVSTRNQLAEYLCKLFGVEKTSELKFVTPDIYAKARLTPNMKVREKIAIVYANGEITLGKGEGISSDKYASVISKVEKDSTVKAVVLRVSSPGGSAQAAEIIREELNKLKTVKPVIVSFGEYAASGGYWISAGADKIFTDRTTITGSIGCFSLIPNFGKSVTDVLDINAVQIKSNKHSDMFSLLRPMDEKEVIAMQKGVEEVYNMFISLVSEGRDMTHAEVDEIAQGRVWTGADAIDVRLADEVGGLKDAIEFAATAANLDDYRIVEYPAVKTSLDKLMENFGQAKVAVETLAEPETIVERIRSSIQTNQKGVYARLPYIYKFN